MATQILFFRSGDRTLDLMKRDDGAYDIYECGSVVATCSNCEDALNVFHDHAKRLEDKVRKLELGM